MPRDLSALVDALFVLLTFAEDLHAETLAAPFGGKAITVPDDRVACTVEGGWTFGPDHRSLKPPTDEASVGQSVEIAAAANDASCATSKARITLLTTGLWPAFDLQTVIAMVDDARVEAKGKRLRGVHLGWSSTGQHGDDVCLSSQQDGAVERCVWGLGTSLPADPTAIALAWSPAGTRGAHDETLFDAEGHRASSDATRLPIARVAVGPLMRPNISLDAALGRGSLTLKHAEAVSGAECAPASCGMDGGAVIVGLVPASTSALSIRIKLAPRVVLRSGDTSDPAPVIRVPITRCPLALVSGTMLREVESQRLVLRVEGRCAKEVDTLRFLVGPTLAVLERSVADGSAAFVVLRVARVDGAQLPITVVREEGDNFVVAQTTAYTQSSPMVHVVLEMGNHRVIDFVPTNVAAAARVVAPSWEGPTEIVPIANRGLATETAVNLHAWMEYEPSRAIGGEPGSALAVVFGPSISIGNLGADF